VRLLLDTCTFLWMTLGSPRLSTTALRLLEDASNEAFLSSGSAWEISIKWSAGKLALPQPPHHFVPSQRSQHQLSALPIREEDVLHLHRLPPLHRDPFDRILVSQAISQGLAILTPDSEISQYPVRVIW
jgi:PIN domain nuclease of toxin-antitoxin system